MFRSFRKVRRIRLVKVAGLVGAAIFISPNVAVAGEVTADVVSQLSATYRVTFSGGYSAKEIDISNTATHPFRLGKVKDGATIHWTGFPEKVMEREKYPACHGDGTITAQKHTLTLTSAHCDTKAAGKPKPDTNQPKPEPEVTLKNDSPQYTLNMDTSSGTGTGTLNSTTIAPGASKTFKFVKKPDGSFFFSARWNCNIDSKTRSADEIYITKAPSKPIEIKDYGNDWKTICRVNKP
jgi:hypothetical protein